MTHTKSHSNIHGYRPSHTCTAVSCRTGPVAWCDHENSTDVKFLRALHSALRARIVQVIKIVRGPWLDVTEALVRKVPIWRYDLLSALARSLGLKLIHVSKRGHRNLSPWNFIQDWNIFIQEYSYENAISEMASFFMSRELLNRVTCGSSVKLHLFCPRHIEAEARWPPFSRRHF